MHCGPERRNMVAGALQEVFAAEDRDQAGERAGAVIEPLAGAAPKVSAHLEEAEEDPVSFYGFPVAHGVRLRATDPLERVKQEIGPRSDAVGIFTDDAVLTCLVGSPLMQQSDEWLVCRR